MSQAAHINDREQQHLAELAEMDMALARHVHAQAMGSDDPAVIAEMGRAYQRVARSARQSVALAAKLRRDAAQAEAEAARLAARAALLHRPWAEHLLDHDEDDEAQDDDGQDEGGQDEGAWEDADGGDDDIDAPAAGPSPAAPLATAPRTPPDPAVLQREADLRAAMRRLIWDERERLEAEETEHSLFDLLEERLESWRRRPGLCDPPLDDQILELCGALGLPTDRAAGWRDLSDPDPCPDPGPETEPGFDPDSEPGSEPGPASAISASPDLPTSPAPS